MTALLALWQQPVSAWSFVDWLVFIIIVCACLGITMIVLRVSGIAVPQWVWQIGLIVLAAFLGILAIRFLVSM